MVHNDRDRQAGDVAPNELLLQTFQVASTFAASFHTASTAFLSFSGVTRNLLHQSCISKSWFQVDKFAVLPTGLAQIVRHSISLL
jgi:hypothetical protein